MSKKKKKRRKARKAKKAPKAPRRGTTAERLVTRATGPDFLTNLPSPDDGAYAVRSLPVIRAYVPVGDCWNATGLGTAGVVRQHPDGNVTYAFFWIHLLENGLKSAFGKDHEPIEEMESFLVELAPMMPPMEQGPVTLASKLIWGAYAFADSLGVAWPDEMNHFLGVVPRPPGIKKEWKRRFSGRKGLAPAGLVDLVAKTPDWEDLPEGKENAILTTTTFRLDDDETAVQMLQERKPEFVRSNDDDDSVSFDWYRDPAGGGTGGIRLFRRRRYGGTVSIAPGRLTVEVQTLSLGARLIGILKEMLGDQIVLENVTWQNALDLLYSRS
jgi:hypothetical protein